MFYILVRNGVVQENIPDRDPAFPEIPIEDRYQAEFLTFCVKSETEIPVGWFYSPDYGFTEENPNPPKGPDPEESDGATGIFSEQERVDFLEGLMGGLGYEQS